MSDALLHHVTAHVKNISERMKIMESFLHKSHTDEMREIKHIVAKIDDRRIFSFPRTDGVQKHLNSLDNRYVRFAQILSQDMRGITKELLDINFKLLDMKKKE